MGKHLAPLKRNASIALWHDREIAAGEDWEKKIGDNLKSADIIVMLISSDFLDSNYIQDVEMVEAKARWKRKEVDLVPVIVRPCAFQRDAFINGLQLLPADGKPIESSHWKYPDEAYKDVADGLGNKINAILEQKQAIVRETEGKRQRAEAEALKLAQQKQLDFINQEVEKAVKIVLKKEFQHEIERQVAERFSRLIEEQAKTIKLQNENKTFEIEVAKIRVFDLVKEANRETLKKVFFNRTLVILGIFCIVSLIWSLRYFVNDSETNTYKFFGSIVGVVIGVAICFLILLLAASLAEAFNIHIENDRYFNHNKKKL